METFAAILPWLYAFVGFWPLLMMLVWVIGGLGFYLLSAAWNVLYHAQRANRLATTGPYARIRHPQYVAFVLIMAGFLLAFTFSFDDFIIAFFVAGSETTLPIYIFSSIRRGVTPEINAVSTVIICLSLLLLFTSRHLQSRRTNSQESQHA